MLTPKNILPGTSREDTHTLNNGRQCLMDGLDSLYRVLREGDGGWLVPQLRDTEMGGRLQKKN